LKLRPFLDLDVLGFLTIGADGVVAKVSLNVNSGFGDAIGLSFDAHANLELNTTGHSKPVPNTTDVVDPGLRIHIDGDITFVGFAKASGSSISLSAPLLRAAVRRALQYRRTVL